MLVWNKIRGFLDWLREDFVKDARAKCSTECVFTESRAALAKAHGVVFHAKTHSKTDFPRAKPKGGAPYLMVSMEQPAYAPLMKDAGYLAKFDGTTTVVARRRGRG